MRPQHYILDAKGVPQPTDLMTWATCFENAGSRVVRQEQIADSFISTVFLGLDHNWSPSGPPVLWETMIFGGKHDDFQNRCHGSRRNAESMHWDAVLTVVLDLSFWQYWRWRLELNGCDYFPVKGYWKEHRAKSKRSVLKLKELAKKLKV